MATDHNFRIKNGLEVGGQLIVTSSGALVVSSVQSSLSFLDNVKAKFGNGSDLQIYHDGSHSYIRDVGTGNLKLQGTNLNLQNEGGTKNYLVAVNSGAVQLYHNNNSKIQTTSTGINVTGRIDLDDSNTQLSSGSGNSLRINTNGGQTEIGAQNTSWSHFYTDRPRFYFSKGLTVESGLIGSYDEDLQIQRAGTTKLTVTTTGVDIVGDLSITGDLNTVNTTTLDVSDKVITAGVGGTAATNSGGGFKISGANVEFIWDNTNTQMTLNKDLKFTADQKLRFGNTYFYRSGDSNNVHFYAPAGFIPHSTTASNNASLGASSFRWDGVFSTTGNFSGNVTVGGDIYAADSNSSTNPSITFTGHTNTGLSVYQSNSVDRLSIITGGAQRVNFGTHGVESFANVYTGNTSSFRNYGGTWTATTGVTGNGFSFINSVDGTALTLSSTGNAVFAGTISSGNIYQQSPDVGGVTPPNLYIGQLTNAYQAGIQSSTHLTFKTTNGSGNWYWYRIGALKMALVGNDLNLVAGGYQINGTTVIDSSSNLTNIGTISSGAITSTGVVTATGGNSTNWNTAYGWGDHGSAGYLTSSSTQSKYLRSDTADTATGTLSLNGRVNIGNSVARPSALNSDSVAQARIGGSDVYLYVASLAAAGGYKVAVQAARASDFASFTLNLQSNGGALQRAGNNVWDAGNDGSGSGLDADTLDSIQASSFLRSDATDTATGALTFSSTANHFNGHIYYDAFDANGNHYPHYLSGSSNNGAQVNLRVQQSGGGGYDVLYIPNGSNDITWRGNKVWNAGNDGSGSGLDADTLDSHQASSFLRSDTNDTYTGTLLLAGAIKDSGDSRSIRLMHGNTNSQPSIGVGEQGTYGMKMRWDSGSSIIFDGYWNSSVTGTRNRDLGYINVNTRVWALPSGVTINGSTAWHAGNDGSGSGLDADTVDSIQASSFLRSDTSDTFGNNTLTIQGTVRSTNNANASGPNFNVSTTNKSNTEYAYRVDRSGSVVGGIRIDGILIAPGGNSTNWNTAYGWGNYASAPSAPGITSTTVVNETIEIVFAASTSTGNTAATSYEVWSDGGTGSDYSLIAKIPYNDIASSMSVVDSSFDDSGTIAYRVYAIRHGAYSTASTTTRSFSMPSLDVSSMSVIPDTNSFHIQYELPDTRFLDHVEIYKDAETTSGALARSGAALIYTGRNPSYKYNIGSSDMEKYHQFWVEVVTV